MSYHKPSLLGILEFRTPGTGSGHDGQPAEIVHLRHSPSRAPEVGLGLALGLGIRSILTSSQGGKTT